LKQVRFPAVDVVEKTARKTFAQIRTIGSHHWFAIEYSMSGRKSDHKSIGRPEPLRL